MWFGGDCSECWILSHTSKHIAAESDWSSLAAAYWRICRLRTLDSTKPSNKVLDQMWLSGENWMGNVRWCHFFVLDHVSWNVLVRMAHGSLKRTYDRMSQWRNANTHHLDPKSFRLKPKSAWCTCWTNIQQQKHEKSVTKSAVQLCRFFWILGGSFPRASERRVLLIVGVCQSSSHLILSS